MPLRASTQAVESRRNFAPLAGLALGFAGVVGYFALVTRQEPGLNALLETPVVFLALAAAGVALSLVGLRRVFSASYRGGFLGRAFAGLLGVVNLGLVALFCWYLFGYSYQLPAAVAGPAIGAPAPTFSLRDQTGATLDLAALRGRNVVLVFYRGFW